MEFDGQSLNVIDEGSSEASPAHLTFVRYSSKCQNSLCAKITSPFSVTKQFSPYSIFLKKIINAS